METPAQYTERLREKYKEALRRLENQGPNNLQKSFDNFLVKEFELEVPPNLPGLMKLSDIMKKY